MLSQFVHEPPRLFPEYFFANGSGFFPELLALTNQTGYHAFHGPFATVLFASITQEPFQYGDVVVFAYRPGPPGQPEREQGLALLRARDDALLARLIERINEFERDPAKFTPVKPIEAPPGMPIGDDEDF